MIFSTPGTAEYEFAASLAEHPRPPTLRDLRHRWHPPVLTSTAYVTGSTSNAGCLGAMARIWSSLESGPVPSKKIPTSAFHLLR